MSATDEKTAEAQLDFTTGDGSGTSRKVRTNAKRSFTADKMSEEYKRRRERNNLAVKKSRTKSKQKARDTLDRVTSLQAENASLENKIKLLTKELNFLKDLFLTHAGGSYTKDVRCLDLETMLNANLDEDGSGIAGDSNDVKNEEDVSMINDHEYTLQLSVKVKV